MKKIALFLALGVVSFRANAQAVFGPLPAPERSIRQNSVSVMEALGDSVWIGPKLNYNFANSVDWPVANADSLLKGRQSVFSLSLRPDTVVAGLGFYKSVAGSSIATAGGFYASTNGGDDWSYLAPPVDPQGTISRLASNGDSLKGYFAFRYGNRDILALAVTVPEQSVPWDVVSKSGVVFSASWASGIVRSRDFGQTWERLLLPPFEQPELNPASSYNFIFQPTPPRNTDTSNPNTSQSWTNFLGFSVLIDLNNRVWFGTAGGLNWSDNAFFASKEVVSWKHAVASESESGILGNWIISIRQNPADSSIWMTNWVGTNSSGEEQFGISSTKDGQRFKKYLFGERINDISFSGNHIFAAGDNGLFISADNGVSWKQIRGIRSANNVITEKAAFQSVTNARNRIWVATSEGLASTIDLGKTWSIVRTNFPLAGKNQFSESGAVDSYAYPNPFSTRQHGFVRIRFKSSESGSATIRIFDSGMNFLKEIWSSSLAGAGEFEAIWDGTDKNGQLVPNGVVFYLVKKPGGKSTGKILILD